MTTLTGPQVAALVKKVGFPASVHATMVAIAKAESKWRVEAVGGPNRNGTYDRGLFQINDVHRKDRNKLVRDATYNTEVAYAIYKSQGLRAWSTYNAGRHNPYMNEARQAVAQASSVTGSPSLPGGGSDTSGSKPAVIYGPPGPQLTQAGIGTPLTATEETLSPLAELKILGAELGGDFREVIIGTPKFAAGIETIPNLMFTVVDPEGDLLYRLRSLWVQGTRVQYQDLDFRIDQIVFEPGGHTTGQITLTCVDDIVYALMKLRGPRTAEGISATQWIAQEMSLIGLDPNRYFLGESVPTQSVIARDVPDQEGQAGSGGEPSAWTTIVRLAKELGKRVFISSRKLVFGSSAFAMQWAAPGALRLSWHGLEESERWLSLPSTTRTSIGERSDVVQVTGRVPLVRARYFRPGVPVLVHRTPAIAADEWISFLCASVEHGIGTDTDGADITLLQPVDPPPQPPQSNNTSSGTISGGASGGGGTDGQIDQFVALALQQAGKRYVFGAEAKSSDPNPRAFDCCLTLDSMISTSSRGPVPIVEVQPGDQVWCWDDGVLAERKVVAVAEQPVQQIYAVKTRNATVRASANHPFLVVRNDGRTKAERGIGVPVNWHTEWVRLDELTKGDLLVTLERTPQPVSLVALPDGTPVDNEVAWLLGQFLGDGHVTSHGMNIAAYRPELRQRIRAIVSRVWGVQATDHPTHGVMVSNVQIRDILTALELRVLGPEKRVPDILRMLPPASLRALLDGYAEADGHFDKRGHQSYSSASRRLIDDVRALHQGLGDRVSNVTITRRTQPIVIKGKTVKNALPLYSFAVYPDSVRRNTTVLDTYGARRALPDRAFTVQRIISITPDGEEPTFDLEIEGAHNYISDGIVVHNSELVEWAAARAGINPKVPDGSANQLAHCRKHGTMLSVQQGINTKGALLFQPGHVAISLGNGRSIEAMNPSAGVKQGNANGRGWTAAAKIPGAKGYR